MMTFMMSMMFSLMMIPYMNKNMMISINKTIMINMLMFLTLNKISFFNYKFYWYLYMDYYSFYLCIMSMWIISLMILTTSLHVNFKTKYLINLLIMMIILMLTFLSINYFMFYFFFESSMIPTLILIMGWGTQFERWEASIYMMMYTLFASLPMMIILIKIYFNFNSLNMIILNNLNLINNKYMYMYLLLAFLIKMPMFFFHLWLPKAHVEAPITGSMLLAGIMLKLGSYGLLRMMMIMEKICMKMNMFIMIFSILGAMYISLICFQQMDMKMLIAYSSIVHMNMTISSLMTMNSWGYKGSLIMMVSHALISSMLFLLVNMIYDRTKSRSLIINKGLNNLMPSLTLFWFLASIFNSASPPSMALFSEIFMIISMLLWNKIFMLILMILILTNMIYMMFFYSTSQHGIIYKNLNFNLFINKKEYLILLLHLLPNLMLILLF
uniref:NADH-ubiquinone oxidoreductase chain 4 n=1 Tax=Pujadella villari TaxID=2943468 RepID=A0A9E8G7M0_9HYME|nr:NADH dehydrogenase subunit 4 [Pujadella villari]